jgi:hypothetical protein
MEVRERQRLLKNKYKTASIFFVYVSYINSFPLQVMKVN